MLEDYFITCDGFDSDSLLFEWRWLIGDNPIDVEAISANGNLFLRGQSGRVYLLDVECGVCECIAGSGDEFREKLGDRHNRTSWLQTYLVRELRRQGRTLGPGQCYGKKIPTVLGGEAGLDNLEAVDLVTHVSVLAQIHRQVKGLGPGSVIHEIRPG